MKYTGLVITLALAVTVVSAMRFRDCQSQAVVDMKSIRATGCDPSPKARYCIFKKNTVAHLSIPFIPKSQVTQLKAVVHGLIGGIPIQFPLDNPNACGQAFPCPLLPGKNVTYTEGLPVKSIYPTLKLKVRWQLVDQNNQQQVCIVFPVSLEP